MPKITIQQLNQDESEASLVVSEYDPGEWEDGYPEDVSFAYSLALEVALQGMQPVSGIPRIVAELACRLWEGVDWSDSVPEELGREMDAFVSAAIALNSGYQEIYRRMKAKRDGIADAT